MMSLTFGLFRQVSDSGPHGPLVYTRGASCTDKSSTTNPFLVQENNCDCHKTSATQESYSCALLFVEFRAVYIVFLFIVFQFTWKRVKMPFMYVMTNDMIMIK